MLKFKQFLENYEDYQHRSASIILYDNQGYVLILHRSSSLDWAPNTWGLPGGSVEEGEQTQEAAIRECIEETKIKPTKVSLLKRLYLDETILDVFTGFANNQKPQLNWEHRSFDWISQNEIDNYDFAPNVKEILAGYFRSFPVQQTD